MRKIFLAIFLCTVLFTFVKLNNAWAMPGQVHIPAATSFHPDKHSSCTTCHTSKMNSFTCTNCHATQTPVPNVTSYSSPSPPVVKYDSPSNQTIHSNYSGNTDACASCHATHIAVGGKLLKWVDSTTACLACHDGTLTSTYNVKAGQIGSTGAKTSGGKFGVTKTEPGLSYHNAFDICTTSAGPGSAENKSVTDSYGVWSTSFNCMACHTPHGQGGNSRILNPDPNGIAMQNKVVGETLTEIIPNVKYSAAKQNWIPGYRYASVTKIYAGLTGTTPATEGYTINYRTGEVEFSPSLTGVNIVKADYVPGVIVKMDVTNKLTAGESVAYLSGINKFCGACHTDYETSAKGTRGIP